MGRRDIDDQVISLPAPGEVLPAVVDDLVCTERRTRSTFVVLQTPVTTAPKALASCTANVPTPPAAPLMRTR